MSSQKENQMPHEDFLLLSMLDEKKEKKVRTVSIKGLIVVSEVNSYATYECKVLIPSLRVKVDDDVLASLVKHKDQHKNKKEYMNVLFMLLGNPVEVSLYIKDDKDLFVNAREISKLDLEEYPVLKNNMLVKKYKEEEMATKKQSSPVKAKMK